MVYKEIQHTAVSLLLYITATFWENGKSFWFGWDVCKKSWTLLSALKIQNKIQNNVFLPVTLHQSRLVIEASTTQVQQTNFCIILLYIWGCDFGHLGFVIGANLNHDSLYNKDEIWVCLLLVPSFWASPSLLMSIWRCQLRWHVSFHVGCLSTTVEVPSLDQDPNGNL